MSASAMINELIKELTVLCVDDEELALEYMAVKLSRMFKKVIKASDGTDGLEAFKTYHPDLIITDNRMTYMDGIEMIKEIRNIDMDVPIILITAYTEKDALVEAINNNVAHFVSKPIDAKKLNVAIEKSLQHILYSKLQDKTLKQELELLKYQEKYHSQQEINAFKKELSLIQNDFFLQKFPVCDINNINYNVYINIFYKPLDVLSGDIYSIRKLDDNSILIFLADSMGKGLSASVTSILTSAHMNHIIDTEKDTVNGPLEGTIKVFNSYIKGLLLEDEILSIIFMKIDFKNEKMEYAGFSSPPIFIKDDEGCTTRLKCNNPPLTKYLSEIRTDTIDIKDIYAIMAITDGLYECKNIHNETMVDTVADGFVQSAMKTDFHKYTGQYMQPPEDDVSCIHIVKINEKLEKCDNIEFESSLENIGKAIEWAEQKFDELISDYETVNMLTLAFTEMVMNSFEHSVLELDNRRKYQMINQGIYDDFIAASGTDLKIRVTIGIQKLWNKSAIFIKISDEGKGFNPNILKTWMYDKEKSDGKGIKISRRITDEIYYANDGKESVIIRVLD